jgi:hypothetical protein
MWKALRSVVGFAPLKRVHRHLTQAGIFGPNLPRVSLIEAMGRDGTGPPTPMAGAKTSTSTSPTGSEDAYTYAPAPKTLLTFSGAEHVLGGISGNDAVVALESDDPIVKVDSK